MIITKTLNAHWLKLKWWDEPVLVLNEYRYEDDDYQFIKTIDVEVDVPEFDQNTFNASSIVALKENKRKVMVVAELAIKEIDQKIESMLAIEMVGGPL
jgi:predicted TIM-barrel fold metal-dependent hydrolase